MSFLCTNSIYMGMPAHLFSKEKSSILHIFDAFTRVTTVSTRYADTITLNLFYFRKDKSKKQRERSRIIFDDSLVKLNINLIYDSNNIL